MPPLIMAGDDLRVARAQRLISESHRKNNLFNTASLKDDAWIVLLRLFITSAQNNFIYKKRLIGLSRITDSTGGTCLAGLIADGLVEPSHDGHAITLTSVGLLRLREYLEVDGRAQQGW
jgi:hypothetical protein